MSDYNVDFSTVKKPQQEEDLTDEQAEIIIQCARDAKFFIRNFVKIQNPTKGSVFFDMRSYQERIIDSLINDQFIIGNLPRQSGKSSIVAAYMLHQAIFYEDMKVGIASNKLVNAKEIMDRIKYMYENLPWFMKTPVIEYNKQSVRFSNYSSIEVATTTESTFRGKSLNRILLDEFAFVKPSVTEEFWNALLPTITAEGIEDADTKLIVISTPNGTEGMYADLWFGAIDEDSPNGFSAIKVTPDEIPGRDEKFKKEMLKKMPLAQYMQEFEGAFLSSKGTLVKSMKLERLKAMEPVRRFGDLKCYVDTFKNRTLSVSIDVGEGIDQDYHAIQILDVETMEQVAEYRNNHLSQTLFTQEILDIFKFLRKETEKDIYYTVENNGVGKGVINLLVNSEDDVLNDIQMIHDGGKKRGMVMSSVSKKSGCMLLKDFIETDRMKINSRSLISELKFFVKTGETYKAESGKNDDLVMAMVLNMLLINKLALFEDKVYDNLNDLDIEVGDNEEYAAPMGIHF